MLHLQSVFVTFYLVKILTTKDLKPQCLLFCFKLNVSEGDAGFPHSSGSLFPFFLTTVNKSFNKVSEVCLKQTYDDKFCGFELAARAEIKKMKRKDRHHVVTQKN